MTPTIVDLTRETARGSQGEIVGAGQPIDDTDDLGVTRKFVPVGIRRGDLVDVGVVLRHLGRRRVAPRLGRSIVPDATGQVGERFACVANNRKGQVFGGVPAGRVDADDLDVGILEDGPRAGREVLEPGADRHDDIGLGGQIVGRLAAGDTNWTGVHRV